MVTPAIHWRVGRHRLEQHRFLAPLRALFTTRGDGSSWPRWRETWRVAHAYIAGLLGSARSQNVHIMAKAVGVPEDRLQRFVRGSPWDYDALQDYLVAHIPEAIQSPGAALVLDDVGIVKQGRHSVGVYRQYSGALGKVGNCQVAVDLTYAVPGKNRNADQVTWPMGMELYLPRPWVEDPEYDLPPGRGRPAPRRGLQDQARDRPGHGRPGEGPRRPPRRRGGRRRLRRQRGVPGCPAPPERGLRPGGRSLEAEGLGRRRGRGGAPGW
jgi:hypothetical protein